MEGHGREVDAVGDVADGVKLGHPGAPMERGFLKERTNPRPGTGWVGSRTTLNLSRTEIGVKGFAREAIGCRAVPLVVN